MAITNLDYDEDDLDETGPSGPTQRPVITEDMAKVLASEDHRMRYYSSLTATDAQPVDLLTLLGHRPGVARRRSLPRVPRGVVLPGAGPAHRARQGHLWPLRRPPRLRGGRQGQR